VTRYRSNIKAYRRRNRIAGSDNPREDIQKSGKTTIATDPGPERRQQWLCAVVVRCRLRRLAAPAYRCAAWAPTSTLVLLERRRMAPYGLAVTASARSLT